MTKSEDRFVLVDFYCHGVPSQLLWEGYTKFLDRRKGTGAIISVNFRDKSSGWHNYSMKIQGEKAPYAKKMREDMFYRFYLNNALLNKPCYQCSFRSGQGGSDLKLGDFWGPKYTDDEKGVSIVIVNTEKGSQVMQLISNKICVEKVDLSDIETSQPIKNIDIPTERDDIITSLQNGVALESLYKKYYASAALRDKIVFGLKSMVPQKLRKA